MDLKTNLIRTYYPSIPSRINTETSFKPFDGTTLENIIDQFLTLPLPSQGKSYNSDLIQKDLEHLNRKLSAVRKTITAWDTYKITEVVIEEDLLAGKIQGLPLNSSLVVNTAKPVYLNGKTYQLGDIVFKDINGNLHQIKSAPSGFFYPSNIHLANGTNTIQIDYSFFVGSQPPKDNQTINGDGTPITQPGPTITAQVELQGDNNFYNTAGILKSPTSSDPSLNSSQEIAMLTDKAKKNLVLPKVFAYLYDDSTEVALEEIYIDNLVEIIKEIKDETTGEITGKTIISNPTTLTIKYIMR